MDFINIDQSLQYHHGKLVLDIASLGDSNLIVGQDYNQLGLVWQAKGNLEKALDFYQKSLEIALSQSEVNLISECIKNIGTVYGELGNNDKALEFYQLAADGVKSIEQSGSRISKIYNNISVAYHQKKNLPFAENYARKALGVSLKIYGENHPTTAIYFNSLAQVLQDKGEVEMALKYFEKALTITSEIEGNNIKVAIYHNNIGQLLRTKKEYDKAINHYEIALKIDLKFFGENHENVAIRYNNLGVAWELKGEKNSAENFYRKSLEILIKTNGVEDWLTQKINRNLNDLLEE